MSHAEDCKKPETLEYQTNGGDWAIAAANYISALEKENIEWEEWFDECYTELGKVRHELDKQVRSSGDRIAELEKERDAAAHVARGADVAYWVKRYEKLREQGE